MVEAVRFFWMGRDAGIPLGEIPEPYRNPLRIRRSVAEAYAPEVVKQLAEGRFVAAAWETGGKISLILCHPNLAKSPFDTFLVDTQALPGVVLKLGSWDEIPESTRLLLTAFGSEAASVEECMAARAALMHWLVEHSQSDMATVVRRYSSFPLGIRSDALEVINIWRHMLVKGERLQVDLFLEEVGRRFEAIGWSRDQSIEWQMDPNEHQRQRYYCWTSTAGHQPRVLLCLNRVTDRRVQGGTYNTDEQASLADLAGAIQHVLKDVLEPAAAVVGLSISYPRLGPISRVGTSTAAVMTALAEAGDGQWPLRAGSEVVWRDFVQTAYREEVAISPDELKAWFIASGWSETAARELTIRFYKDVALIREYEEAGRQPA